MKVLYVVPGIMSKVMGVQECERRQSILRSWAFPGTQADLIDIEEGPSSIESLYEEFLAVPQTVERIIEAEKNGYDAVILGCYGDPGMDAARELVNIPVIGPGEASFLIGAMLGNSFSIVTVMDSIVGPLKKQVKLAGVESKLASVRAAKIPVLELAKDKDASLKKILDVAGKCIEDDGADVILLGCMSMAFLGVSDEMQKALNVPVVNPAKVGLKLAESLVGANLSHSKKAFMTPPKLLK